MDYSLFTPTSHSPPAPLVPSIPPPPSVIQRLDSANEETWLLIGDVAEQMGDSKHALFAYENALRHNPSSLSGLTKIARIKGDYPNFLDKEELAIKYFTKLVEADPSIAHNWHLLGRAYMNSNNYSKASEIFQEAVQRDGENSIIWCSIGALYIQVKQYYGALQAYSRALEINPYISEAWLGVGSLYERCDNQISDAIAAYTRASALDPGNVMISKRLELLKTAHATGGQIPVASEPQDRKAHHHPPGLATSAGSPLVGPLDLEQPLPTSTTFLTTATTPRPPPGGANENNSQAAPQPPSSPGTHSHPPTSPPPVIPSSGSDVHSSHCVMSPRHTKSNLGPMYEESNGTKRSRKSTRLIRMSPQERVSTPFNRRRAPRPIQPLPFPNSHTIGAGARMTGEPYSYNHPGKSLHPFQ